VAFEPHVVVALDAVGATVIRRVDAEWSAPGHLPEYLLGGPSLYPPLLVWLRSPDQSAVRSRIRGVRPSEETDLLDGFSKHFRQVNGSSPFLTYLGRYYDAAYALLYALAAAGPRDQIGGADVARGMRRLSVEGAMRVNVGPGFGGAEIVSAFSALSAGKDIDLSGVSSRLDWNVQTGALLPTSFDYSVHCVSSSGIVTSSGQVWNPEIGAFTGTFSCP
jgi:hypothetical protein